jgi:nicotinamidase-related amidase
VQEEFMATEFPVVPSNTAMLFFDTCNSSLHPRDPTAQAALNPYITLLENMNRTCRAAGIAVFYTRPEHRPDLKDWPRTVVDLGHRGEPGSGPRMSADPGSVAGTWEAQVIDEIAPQPGDYVITKHRWSSFHQTHLELSLRTAGIDTIILAGGATEVGIASTAYSARDHGLNLIVLRDACRSTKEGVNEFYMDRIFPIFARVMTVDEAIAWIGNPAP